MPMIPYKCTNTECLEVFNILVQSSANAAPNYACRSCGSLSKRTLSSPSSSSKITVGRDTQARGVEIYPDIIEMNHERAKKGENRGE